MKTTNCIWEQANIGKKTVEITIEKDDVYSENQIKPYMSGYEYVVIKVPMNRPQYNIGLSALGFSCIETQMNVGVSRQDFDYAKVQQLYDDTSFEVVDTPDGFQSVVSRIQPGMFSTDRISIDPMFGEKVGCQRYINWLTSEFKNSKSELVKVLYQNEHVGFMLIRVTDDTVDLLLNGLYKPFQGKGLGMLTPASPMMFIKMNSLAVNQEITSISSNNIPVVKLYNRLQFELLSQTYVFVKHIKQ